MMPYDALPNSAGLLEIAIPTQFGGIGRSWTEFVNAFQRQAATTDLGWMIGMAGQAWVLKALMDHGSEQQKRIWLPQILQGALSATALAEPQSGSDLANLQTRLRPDGEGWLLTGQKRNISFGAEAELMVCLATADEGHFRLVLLDRAAQPWLAEASPAKIGLANLPTADIRFADLPIHMDDLLAADRHGLATLADFMTFGRALLALGATAILRQYLQTVMQFAATRQAGGQAIDQQQYVQHKLTDAHMQITQTDLLARRALQAHLAGEQAAVGLGSMAKIAATEALLHCSQTFASILGTEGFQDGPIGRLAVDALAFQAVGGTEEVHRINLFKQMKAGRI